ncbi:class I SAM-dependent methyltransferase [Novosphingobium beihaiensis]|uniref:Class I SAM-dependent methyltransferase n=1 Tax=Novosphingobium beihaiensis TaxID=2930389 RepID=A0ABT0BQB4_9SPHN|nr:class I SAM-dependent methyltransferase [Novosphingobium beihaiensis]MCJ2187038.1 class I SAM-dependent methyltransferase [Novosphingobium beihaiensis]
MHYDPGSYRDPAGRIVVDGRRIFRAIFDSGRVTFEAAVSSGVIDACIERGQLLPMNRLPLETLPTLEHTPCHVIEHPRLDYISYPYEWCFAQLKAAALLHLDLHLDLLAQGFTLSDATAYNVQFIGTRPVFIDHLSIVPYNEGEPWIGQRQFTMQFLAPLILWSKKGIAPNAWYRGSLEGISPEDLLPLLSFKDKLSFTVMAHVVAQAKLHTQAIKGNHKSATPPVAQLTRKRLEAILSGLRDYVMGLSTPNAETVWGDYETNNSYDADRRAAKHDFVSRVISQIAPGQVFDLGCNSGDYSRTALDNGAKSVVGFDFDFGALERAYSRFSKENEPVLPLWLDATNPSPAQGWAGAERKSLAQRSNADALLALAFIHHLSIARNIPLDMAVDWLISLAPSGIIEFPDKGDPMVEKLLSTRKELFPEYCEEAFLSHVAARARIVETLRIPGSQRTLLHYARD